MPVFIVATTKSDQDIVLEARISEQFPNDNYELGRGQWLVSYSGTAKDLYSKLTPEYVKEREKAALEPLPAESVNRIPLSSTVVFGVGGYWGVAPRDMWEWIAAKLEGASV